MKRESVFSCKGGEKGGRKKRKYLERKKILVPVSVGRYCLVLGGTGSVQGGTGSYMKLLGQLKGGTGWFFVILGQYRALLVVFWWYLVSIGQY